MYENLHVYTQNIIRTFFIFDDRCCFVLFFLLKIPIKPVLKKWIYKTSSLLQKL